LAEVRTDIEWPVTLQSVFDRALAPDSADRFPRVEEFADELAAAINLMTPSQTAEMYSRALQGRGIGAARRTPSIENPTLARPVDKKATPALRAATVAQPAIARPIGMPDTSKRRLFPVLLMVGVFVYGLHWYGSRQPSGTAREVADRIGSISRTVAGPLMPFIDRMRAKATVPDGTTATPAAAAAPRKRVARPKPDSTSPDSGARDTSVRATTPPDTTIPPGW
jgi:serine/threonine-protein kinase